MLVKHHARAHKTDPLVDESELIQAKPKYAHVHFQDRKESTVSHRRLGSCFCVESNKSGDESLEVMRLNCIRKGLQMAVELKR